MATKPKIDIESVISARHAARGGSLDAGRTPVSRSRAAGEATTAPVPAEGPDARRAAALASLERNREALELLSKA